MYKLIITFSIVLLMSACGEQGSNDNSITDKNIDSVLAATLSSQSITGDPSNNHTLPNIADPIPQLGMKLFFTKALSGDKDTACVSCHHPKLGGGDNLSLSIGVAAISPNLLGPGRRHSPLGEKFDGGPTIPRNAPTIFNIGLWDSVLFYDGRVESLTKSKGQNGFGTQGIRTPETGFGVADNKAGRNLVEAQARLPVTSKEEMKGFSYGIDTNNSHRDFLAKRLQTVGSGKEALVTNDWLIEFESAFGLGTAETLITFSNITHALAEYQRSQLFINNPFKAYVEGRKSAISNSAKRGALLFFRKKSEGGANCAACHKGDFYSDESFHIIAVPQIGRSKNNKNRFNAFDDFGRFRETRLESDMYKFRTPTLLNIAKTGPWGHAGAYTSLEAIVRHHLNPQLAIDNFDFNQVDPSINTSYMKVNSQFAMDRLLELRAEGKTNPILEDVTLTDLEVNQLIEFLKTLTDPCIEDSECIAAWIPSSDDADPDLLRVNAVDSGGLPL